MTEATTTTMATFLESATTVLESCIDWTQACGDMIMSTPLLLVPCVLGIGLIGIGIIKRFI